MTVGLENPFLKLGFDNPKRKREFPLRESSATLGESF